jgi:molybdopterin/thiamine biosynthesis adenylyltransferase
VKADEIEEASQRHMRIPSRSFLRAIKRAAETKQAFVFVHSHPADVPGHSAQDDREEVKLCRTVHIRAEAAPVHGSLVFCAPDRPVGRVWLPDGSIQPMGTVRVVGNRLRLFRQGRAVEPNLALFDRQVRAFGREIQSLLGVLRVGVVGAGGTGSAVCEQLARLGVGEILVADGQNLEASNVTRVYGSAVADQGRHKADIQADHLRRIGLGTEVRVFGRDVTYRSVLQEFRFCDVIFGCTDDEWGRALLNRLALYYHVPVFDMGVKIDSHDGRIRSVNGRVTTLMAGTPCLLCRGRISADRVRAESIAAVNPREVEHLRREGYAPELQDPAPAVVPFTTAMAASAVLELLHRLSGFMGSERKSSEVLHLFDQTRTRTNGGRIDPDCFCQSLQFWGRGDVEPFLDSTWRPE